LIKIYSGGETYNNQKSGFKKILFSGVPVFFGKHTESKGCFHIWKKIPTKSETPKT